MLTRCRAADFDLACAFWSLDDFLSFFIRFWSMPGICLAIYSSFGIWGRFLANILLIFWTNSGTNFEFLAPGGPGAPNNILYVKISLFQIIVFSHKKAESSYLTS